LTLGNEFNRPDLGRLLGFVGEKGTQAGHLIGETRLWNLLVRDFLIQRLNAGLQLGDPQILDRNGRWNGVLLPGGASDTQANRDATEKAATVVGAEAHRGRHVDLFDKLWFDDTISTSPRFLNQLNLDLANSDISPQEGRVILKNFIDTMKLLMLDQAILDRMFNQQVGWVVPRSSRGLTHHPPPDHAMFQKP
jgi:hypothetical protein